MKWIFRFLGKMPRGRFEYTCGICGNYDTTNIPNDDIVVLKCKCGAIINIWDQDTHWHMSIEK